MSQQIISRLLFVEQEVPKAVITSWVTSSHKGEEAKASKALSDLGVWTESSTQGGMVTWKVNDTFRENLQRALLGGGDPWTMSETLEPDKNARDKAFLDKYSQDRWSTVLHFMVASSRQQEGISDDAVQGRSPIENFVVLSYGVLHSIDILRHVQICKGLNMHTLLKP